jgi:hypothetical protein
MRKVYRQDEIAKLAYELWERRGHSQHYPRKKKEHTRDPTGGQSELRVMPRLQHRPQPFPLLFCLLIFLPLSLMSSFARDRFPQCHVCLGHSGLFTVVLHDQARTALSCQVGPHPLHEDTDAETGLRQKL